MVARELEANVRERSGVAIVDLKGEISATAEAVLNGAYVEAERRGAGAILLNFGAVDYINSSGIAQIVGLLGRARDAGRRVLACGLSEHYVEIFRITRLADYLTICADEEGALAEASK
jgi:anti-anti-sigma factor